MDTTFADVLQKDILASPDFTFRGRRILRILKSPDSPHRTKHINSWEDAVRKHYKLGDGTIDWQHVLLGLEIIAEVLGIILLLLSFLTPEEIKNEAKESDSSN